MRFPKLATLCGLTVVVPQTAFAHEGVGLAMSFSSGVLHPVTGLDHVLAMFLVGMLAWQLGGKALWLVPSTFVLVMAVGGVLGMAAVNVPFVELGIALSVVVLGAAIAFGLRLPAMIAVALVGLLAIFHGHAHGAEMQGNSSMVYALGFMLSTALLHAGGIGAGFIVERTSEHWRSAVLRIAGGLASVVGLVLLSAAV